MKTARELETKLEVGADVVLPLLDGIRGAQAVKLPTRSMRARYLDTSSLALARAGLTLRHRTGEGRARWTLKLGGWTDSGLDRQELTVIGPMGAPPKQLYDVVSARLRGAELGVVVDLRTRRSGWALLDADGVRQVEVVDDEVQAFDAAGELMTAWRELEVERAVETGKAAARLAVALVEALQGAGARVGDQAPKALRALGLSKEVGARVRPRDPATVLVRQVLETRREQLLTRDAEVRLGLPDAVHQFRVSCRRLRTDLRTFRRLLPDPRNDHLRGELSWLAASFGGARDLEVLRERLRRTAGEDGAWPLELAPVDAMLEERAKEALATGLETLCSARYSALLDLLDEVAAAPLSEAADEPCRTVLPALVERAWARLAEKAGALTADGPDADWHRARIAAKRARYAAETAQEVRGGTSARHLKAARHAQELLGEHQDAVVAVTAVLDLAASRPEDAVLALLCGQLAERERAHARAARRAFLEYWSQRAGG